MITEALPLRTESPSITEVISDQQPEDHTSQLACCAVNILARLHGWWVWVASRYCRR